MLFRHSKRRVPRIDTQTGAYPLIPLFGARAFFGGVSILDTFTGLCVTRAHHLSDSGRPYLPPSRSRHHFSGENLPPPLLHAVFVKVSCDVSTLGS